MDVIPADEFMQRMSRLGIGLDPDYAEAWPRNLSYRTDPTHDFGWSSENDGAMLVRFLTDALEVIADNGSLYFWAKSPGWYDELERVHPIARVWCRDIVRLNAESGAIAFSTNEHPELLSVLACSALFGWSWPSDMYVIPESGAAILQVMEQDTLMVSFPSAAGRQAFCQAMESRNWRMDSDFDDDSPASNELEL